MSYSIELTHPAIKALKKFPRPDQKKIRNKIEKLKETPFPVGSQKLVGMGETYRIRSGNYRIIYQVKRTRLYIMILRIGHRKEIYR